MTGTHDDPTTEGISLVQPGWHIYSRDGLLIGEVLVADERFMHVRLEGEGDRNVEIDTDTIVEQEEPEMRARISLTADEITSS